MRSLYESLQWYTFIFNTIWMHLVFSLEDNFQYIYYKHRLRDAGVVFLSSGHESEQITSY